MKLYFWSLLLSLFVSVVYSQSGIAVLTPVNSSISISGVIRFSSGTGGTTVSITLSGLSANAVHAIKITDYGDITSPIALGEVLEGPGRSRGCPPNGYIGDLGNFTASAQGSMNENRNLGSLEFSGDNSIIGRAVVVYDTADDCSLPTFTGRPIAFGVIGIPSSSNAVSKTSVDYATCSLINTVYCASCVGIVTFYKNSSGVLVTAQVSGFTPDAHGIHVHQWGDLTSSNASAAGSHYNPNNVSHGLPPRNPRHMGDLGNIQTFQGQTGWFQLFLNDMNLDFFVGRSVVVHENIDHGAGAGCDQAGTSGRRFAQCVIGIALTNKTPVVPIPLNTTFVDIPCTSPTVGQPTAARPPNVPVPNNAPHSGPVEPDFGSCLKVNLFFIVGALCFLALSLM